MWMVGKKDSSLYCVCTASNWDSRATVSLNFVWGCLYFQIYLQQSDTTAWGVLAGAVGFVAETMFLSYFLLWYLIRQSHDTKIDLIAL